MKKSPRLDDADAVVFALVVLLLVWAGTAEWLVKK